MKRIIIGLVSFITIAWLSATGCDENKTRPEENYNVTGAVTLSGTMRDVTGSATGPLEVIDETSVRVMLFEGSQLRSIVLSDSGTYTFSGVETGTYNTGSTVNNNDFVNTPNYTVNDTDFVVPDTLRVTSQGDAAAYPNPTNGEVSIRVVLPNGGDLAINILSADQRVVRRLHAATYSAGTVEILWDGRGDDGAFVPDGAYWALIDAARTLQHELIVRDATP